MSDEAPRRPQASHMDSIEQRRADRAIWLALIGAALVLMACLFNLAFTEPSDSFERDCTASNGRVEESIIGSGRYCFSPSGRPIDIDRQ